MTYLIEYFPEEEKWVVRAVYAQTPTNLGEPIMTLSEDGGLCQSLYAWGQTPGEAMFYADQAVLRANQ